MKTQIVNRLFRLTFLVLLGSMVMVSCNKDDDDDDTPPVVILDGYYVTGAGTAVSSLVDNGLMSVARNEVVQEDRAELMEIYMAVKGGADGFNIVMVSGSTQKTYGPGADFAEVTEPHIDEPKLGLWRGALAETADKFTVPEDGLYHIAFDSELMIVVIAKVEWGLIGGATPGGWGDNTVMPMGTFDLNTITFEVAEVTMLENDWKFRYSNGWKVILDADADVGNVDAGVKVNSNFGGEILGQFNVDPLVAGGENFGFETYANYKMTMTWTLGAGHTAAFEYVSDAEPLPEYPDSLYMIGASVGSWSWDEVDLPMNATHSHPELFWKIVWIENGVADAGFKFAPTEEWGLDFGKDGEPTNGVWAKGSENMPEPATSGYYMVVVDLENETIEVNAPTVYLIGDATGTWDPVPENLFNVDNANEVVSLTKDLADGNILMFATASTLACDWWQAEFMILNDIIEYRSTGDDQEAVIVTAGNYTINLKFIDETGSIIAN